MQTVCVRAEAPMASGQGRPAELLSFRSPWVVLFPCLLGLEQKPQKTQPISRPGVQA